MTFQPVFDEDDKKFAANLFARIRVESASPGGGVTRPSYSYVETRVAQLVAEAANGLELHTTYDDVANLVITTTPQRRRADKKATWLGSHLDSVPNGGNYDGLAGVVAAVLVLGKAKKLGIDKPLVGLGLRGEESAWFGMPHVGAKAMLGQLKFAELDRQRLFPPSLTLGASMMLVEANVSGLSHKKAVVDPDEIEAWWELHIEQGPVLECAGAAYGLVSSIAGSVRAPAAIMRGKAGHSGTTPHSMREDAVMRFADLMMALESRRAGISSEILGSGLPNRELRFTCGRVSTNIERHSITSIADEVTFSLDVRGEDLSLVRDFYEFAASYAGDDLAWGDLVTTPPCPLDHGLLAESTRAAREVGGPFMTLPSGAGHDASVFQGVGIPSGMIFVRNANGSHNPNEAMAMADFMTALEVLWRSIIH